MARNGSSIFAYFTGLDPSGWGFGSHKPNQTLMKGDASFVWILHTNTQKFGIDENLGDIDLYPNGGATQSECEGSWFKLDNSCAHGKAWDYYKDYLSGKTIVDPNDETHGRSQKDKIVGPIKVTPKPTATILILDISPSMLITCDEFNLTRMANLITASRQLIKSFPLGHYCGIVQFGESARITANMTFVSNDTVRQSLLSGLPTCEFKMFGTSIGAGLRTAVNMAKPLVQQRLVQSCPKFILISDGNESESPYIADVSFISIITSRQTRVNQWTFVFIFRLGLKSLNYALALMQLQWGQHQKIWNIWQLRQKVQHILYETMAQAYQTHFYKF